MGYLTTVTVYNDSLDLLKRYPQDFCDKLYETALGHETKDFGVGHFANFAHVQRTRHADDHTTYVHMGNCVTEVNPYSPEFKALLERTPGFAAELVAHLEREVRTLKKMLRERETRA